MRARLISVAVAIAVIAMVAVSCWQRWHLLAATPYPVGIDGYYYPVQLRALLEHGTLAYPASPLAFWFMAPFAAATDPITGAKLGAALGGALIAVPAYGVGARLGRGRGAGLVAAALASSSAGSAYLSIEFVKQGLGPAVALAALWAVLAALATPARWRIALAAPAVVAALATHKVAAALALVIAVPAVLVEVRHRLRGRRLIYAVLAGVAAAVGFLVLGLVAPQRFVSLHDLGLVGELVSATARWSAPALVTPHLALVFDHEAAIGGVLALVAAGVLVWQRTRAVASPELPAARALPPPPARGEAGEQVAAWIVIGLALAIALPWLAVTDPQGLGFRLRIAAFVPMALCAAIVSRALARVLRAPARDLALGIVAALVVAHGVHADRSEGQVVTHPALAAAVMAATDQVPANATVIVPERHILFMVAWYTRAPVSLRPEPVPYAQRVRLFGLAFIGQGSPLDEALDAARRDPTVDPPIGLHPRHRNGLVLVTEPTWDWLLAHLPPKPRAYFAAWPTI